MESPKRSNLRPNFYRNIIGLAVAGGFVGCSISPTVLSDQLLAIVPLTSGLPEILKRIWRKSLRRFTALSEHPPAQTWNFLQQYDHLTSMANDIILLIDERGIIVNVNERAASAYGYTRDAMCGMKLSEIRSPETRGKIPDQMKKVAEVGGLVFETVHLRADGRSFPVEASSRLIEFEGRKFFRSIVRDISERKKSELRLTRLNECFLSFGDDPLANINALVALCGELLGAATALYNRLEGELLCAVGRWNTPAEYASGDKAEGHVCMDVIAGTGEELHVVRNLPATKYYLTDTGVRGSDLRTYIGRGVRFGTENIGSLCALFRDDFVPTPDDEKLMGILAAAIGVQENRFRREAALRESEERYRRLVEFSPDSIAVHSGGRFVFVNSAGLRLIGAKDATDLIGKPILAIVHPDSKSKVMERAFQSPGKQIDQPFLQEKFVRLDGGVVDVEVGTTPIMYEGKSATLVVARDLEDRKREREELVRLRKAVDSSGEIIFITDEEGTIRFVNPEFSRVYGYQPEEIVGRVTPRILKSGVLDDATYKAFWKSLLERTVFKGELVNKRKDGSLITVEGSASPIVGDNGEVLGYLAIQRDVTIRKLVEDALRNSEASYRGLFSSVVDAIYIQDRDGKFLDVNQGAIDMYGYPREFFIGRSPVDLAAPGMNDIAQTAEAVRKAFQGETQRFEWWGRRSNGEIFPKEVRLSRSSYFGKEVVVALGQDITERKRGEEAVRRSEIRFRSVWEGSRDGMRILDAEGKFVMVNDAFCRLVGKKSSELIGKTYTAAYERTTPETEQADIQTYRQRFAARLYAAHQEVELPLASGIRLLVDLTNSLLEIPQEPPLLLSIFRDITDRRLAERRLQESEEKFRTLSEQSPNMIYINKGGRVVYVNDKCVETMGFSKEEFYAPSFNFLDLIGEEHVPLVRRNFARHAAGEEIPPYEYVLYTKDRKRLVGLHTTRLIDYQGTPAILGIITDVTEHRLAEEELRKLHQAVEQSPASIIITDKNGFIEYANARSMEVSGYAIEELQGKTPRIFKSGHTPEGEYRKLWETISSGREWKGEFHNRKKNGELYWEYASISPIRDAAGSITHFLAVKENITDRKMLEQRLWQSQKMESLGTLASGIAHDFNNILGIILGYASLLGQKAMNPALAGPYLESIITAAERGAGLVRQILTFARKSDFKLESVDVNSLIGEVAKMLGETFPKTISLSLQLEKSLPLLSIDRTQLHQALLNLCVNARDAMADHGALSISTRLTKGELLAPRFAAPAGRQFVEISVSDTGSGMDEFTLSRIFEPFFTTKDIGKGTGLGLSVVFGVIQEHQGYVDVQSSVGSGSRFNVYLPVPETSVRASSSPGADTSDIPGGTETILVIEDEELMLEFVVTVLRMKGYDVLQARDGEEAIQIHADSTKHVDLVLSDIGLPKLDGWETCQRLRNEDPGIIVCLASGYLDPTLKSEILRGGVHGFISKPYSGVEVLRRIREMLDAR